MHRLAKLTLWNCDSVNSLPLDNFPILKELWLRECQNLESLQSLPQQMHRLLPSSAVLEINGCPETESFPEGALPSKLEELQIHNCNKLLAQHRHWNLERLTSLKTLNIEDCDVALDSFPAGSLPLRLFR